jgi:pilus assembly protein CpaE
MTAPATGGCLRTMAEFPKLTGDDDDKILSIALIGPDPVRRKAIAAALAGTWDSPSEAPKPPEVPVEPSSFNGANGSKDHDQPVSTDEAVSPDDPPPSGVHFERIFLTGINANSNMRQHTIQEFTAYPAKLDDPINMLGQHYDVVIVDIESDPEYALDVVRTISDDGYSTAMVYSSRTDRDMVVRCMRVGAREFLALPLASADMANALARVVIRRPMDVPVKKASPGRLFVFLGTKGGSGVTTLASNFAVALAQESGKKTLLIDLGLPMGDVAINLGITSEYSTANAFHDFDRLDVNFLSSLLVAHSTGLSVLAAPGDLPGDQPAKEAVDKLLAVARQAFDYVVIDVGSRIDFNDTAIFDLSTTFYLITQVGVSELRNANRMIARFFPSHDDRLQIVLNRYTSRALLFDETHVSKALTRRPQWKVPDDFAAARRTLNTATPLVMDDTPIANSIRQMARKACGLSAEIEEKKKGFSLFGRAR